MLGVNPQSGFQGYAYIILQVIRCANIAVFVAVMAACALMLVFAKLPNGYQFFDDIGLVFVLAVAGLLAYSETELKYGRELILRNWPVLGGDRGFTWLGFAMFLMGCHLLGGLSDDTYTKDGVPSQISQVILGAGIIALAFGITNVLASFVFKNKESGVRAREIRQTGAITRNYEEDGYSQRSASVRKEKTKSNRFTALWKGGKPKISHPITHDVEQAIDDYPGEDRSSPIIPEMKRPPTALHPAYSAGNRASRYSEVSHIHRFDDDNKI